MKKTNEQNNEVTASLRVDLKFNIPIDMTEFNSQTLKVQEFNTKRKEFITSKFPESGKIKEIISQCQKEIEALGFECVKNIAYSEEETLGSTLKDLLSLPLLGILGK